MHTHTRFLFNNIPSKFQWKTHKKSIIIIGIKLIYGQQLLTVRLYIYKV